LLFACSCKGQKAKEENEEEVKARWYFYAYANNLTVYEDKTNERLLHPYNCGLIMIRIENKSIDTANVYFKAF
jgi:hypothetical protein